jgi:hypothetical protein
MCRSQITRDRERDQKTKKDHAVNGKISAEGRSVYEKASRQAG